MEERIEKALLSINGAKVKVEESKKSRENKHKKFFIQTLNTLVSLQERSDNLFVQYGVNILMYEDLYFQVIEDLVYEHFGPAVSEVMFWWVSEVKNPKDKKFYIFEEKSEKKYAVKTPTQVYNTLKKLKLFKNL